MARTQPLDRLSALLAEAAIELDRPALAALQTHFDLLLRWNQKINLTGIRDPEQILRRHFLESLLLTKVLKLGTGVLYDIGSGAGFPGLPLKAAHPELKLILVESSQKKAAFLKEVIRAAGLQGTQVEATRLETLVQRADAEAADWITMRAVGRLHRLVPLLRRLLAPHGKLALFLGRQDVERVPSSTGGFAWESPVLLPGSKRRFILVGENLGA